MFAHDLRVRIGCNCGIRMSGVGVGSFALEMSRV